MHVQNPESLVSALDPIIHYNQSEQEGAQISISIGPWDKWINQSEQSLASTNLRESTTNLDPHLDRRLSRISLRYRYVSNENSNNNAYSRNGK